MRAIGALALAVLSVAAFAPSAHAARRDYLIALGDSYALGEQDGVGPTHHGPADQLLPLARKRGYRFTLVNMGCLGATSGSMLDGGSCSPVARAVDFIRRHRGRVGLVTISIGGNDVRDCLTGSGDAVACTRARMVAVRKNVKTIVRRLRAAGGRKLRIIGSTYPDVILGAWVLPVPFGDDRFTLAAESLTAFSEEINPGLRAAYASAGGAFVDVTRATGAYGPFTTVRDETYGTIPVPVEKVCALTSFCASMGLHMTTRGYHIIATLEAAKLPRR